MGWIFGFPEITETSSADAFEMTCSYYKKRDLKLA